MDFIQEETRDLKNIFNRFKKRNFSGNSGQIMKNSGYQLTQNLIFKIGSLFFTIVLARMLLPERMGLYNLALATIVLFVSFSDLGIGSALITFGARMIEKKKLGKTKGYLKKLLKWKLYLISITSLALLLSAYFIAKHYYAKPIFYALLIGALYLPIVSLINFAETIFKTNENFKIPMLKEILFQASRLIIVPLGILLFLKTSISNQGMILVTILALIASHSISLLFLILKVKNKVSWIGSKEKSLNKQEIKKLKKFILPLSATALAGMFFGYVDTLMLGHYVASEFIAYYGAAFSLVGGAAIIIGFLSTSLLPIFAKKTGKELEKIFKKTRNLTITISLFAGIFTWFISYYIIKLVYGVEYISSVPILKYFSLLVIILPILALYVGYFTTQKKTKQLAFLILGSAVLNVIFNFICINYGLDHYGQMGAVFGAVFATILSRILYLTGLIFFRKRKQ